MSKNAMGKTVFLLKVERRQVMTNSERKNKEKAAAYLISRINTYYDPSVSASLLELHGGTPTDIGSWELESLIDDLLTIVNDHD